MSRAHGRLRQRVFEMSQISARRGSGTLTGRATIDYATDAQGLLTFTAEAKDVPTSALLEPYAAGWSSFWEGAVSGRCNGKCRLGDRATMLSTLSTVGVLSSSAGVYHSQQLIGGIAPYLGERTDLLDIRFSELKKSFKIADGRLIIDPLSVDGSQRRV